MDVNLTYGVPLQLNVTLNTPPTPTNSFWAEPLGIAIIALIGILAGAIIAGIVPIYLDWNNNKRKKIDNRIISQNNLHGYKRKVPSYYALYLNYRINENNLLLHSKIRTIKNLGLQDSEYKKKTKKEIIQIITSQQEKHPEYGEALRVRERAEEYTILVPKVSEEFGSLIGQIEILFHDRDVERKIPNLVKEIEDAEANIDTIEKDISKNFKDLGKKQVQYLESLNPDKLDEFIQKIDDLDMERKKVAVELFEKEEKAKDEFESKIEALWNHLNRFKDC